MSYWEDRQRQLNKALAKDEEKLKKRLSQLYDTEARRLEKEIANYFQEYGRDNVIEYRKLMEALPDRDKVLLIERMDEFAEKFPEHSHLMPVRESIYKLDRLQGLQQSVAMQQLEIGAAENEMIKEHLEKTAQRSLTAAAETMGFGKTFYTMNKDIMKNFVGVPWSNGKNFSDNIWDNKAKLTRYLNQDIAQAFARGDSYARIVKALNERFGKVSRNDAYRLVYTEGTFVQTEASMQPFKEDFEKYRISTVGDSKVCPICRAMAEEVFEIKDRTAGESFPPFHPWCRCTFIVVVDDWDKWIDDYVAKHGAGTQEQAEKVANRLDAGGKPAGLHGMNAAEIDREGRKIVLDSWEEYRKKFLGNAVPYDDSKIDDSWYDLVKLGGFKDKAAVEEIYGTLDSLTQKFYSPINELKWMDKAESTFSKAFATSTHRWGYGSAEIRFNPLKLGEKGIKRLRELSEKGYSIRIPIGREIEYLTTHEFAHTILNLGEKLPSKAKNFVQLDVVTIKSARAELYKVWEGYAKETQRLQDEYNSIARPLEEKMLFDGGEITSTDRMALIRAREKLNSAKISEYSLSNPDEFVAEAFTDAIINGGRSRYSKEVLDIITKYFGR